MTMDTESEMVYQVDVSYADDPEGDTLDIITPAELLVRYPWTRPFQAAIEAGMFQARVMFDLTLVVIHPPSHIPVTVPQEEANS